jgi:predicted tellurium resistance membrane protein TerC
MFRELREGGSHELPENLDEAAVPEDGKPKKTLRQAITQILVADISMSLDNVLAVAGASKDHPYILIIGLAVSVVLMGVAASFIARLLDRHRWIAWLGLLIILYVAGQMVWAGTHQVAGEVPYAYGYLFLPLGFMALPMGTFPVGLWIFATVMQVVVLAAVATVVVDMTQQIIRRNR